MPPPVRARSRGRRHRRGGRQGRQATSSPATTSCWRGCSPAASATSASPATAHLCEAGMQSAMVGEEFVFEKDGMPIGRMAGVGSFADHTVVRATAAIKIREDVPLDRACLVGCGVMTGVGAAINTAKVAAGRHRRGVRLRRRRPQRHPGRGAGGAARIIAVDLVRVEAQDGEAVRRHRRRQRQGRPTRRCAIRELTGGLGVDYAFEVIGAPGGDRAGVPLAQARRQGRWSSACRRWAGRHHPGLRRWRSRRSRVIGSLYGSGNLHRDMLKLIDLYMQQEAQDRRAGLAHDQARRRQRRLRRDGEGRGRALGHRVLSRLLRC